MNIIVARGTTDYTKRKANVITNQAFYRGTVDYNTESFRRGDVLMRTREEGDMGCGFDRSTPVRGCLNGLAVPQGIAADRMQAAIAKDIAFAGVAVTDTPFNDKLSKYDSVTAQIGGIATIFHTGTKLLQPGDRVRITAPDRDLNDLATLPPSAGPGKTIKIRPVTTKVDYDVSDDVAAAVRDANAPLDVVADPSNVAMISQHGVLASLTAVAAVGITMIPRIVAITTAIAVPEGVTHVQLVRALTQQYFPGGGPGLEDTVRFADAMLGSPWIEFPNDRITVNGHPVRIGEIRKRCIAEFRRRLTKRFNAFGTPGAEETDNPLMLPALPQHEQAAAVKNEWETRPNAPRLVGAACAVNNIAANISMRVKDALEEKDRTCIGTVINGGVCGAAMDILLNGSDLCLK